MREPSEAPDLGESGQSTTASERLGDRRFPADTGIERLRRFARETVVVVLSDGLERGGPDTMTSAVVRLSRLAWRVSWLTPLAADPAFRPESAGLAAILPYLDDLGDGASVDALCRRMLSIDGVRGRRHEPAHRPYVHPDHRPGRRNPSAPVERNATRSRSQ